MDANERKAHENNKAWVKRLADLGRRFPRPLKIQFVTEEEMAVELSKNRTDLRSFIWMGREANE